MSEDASLKRKQEEAQQKKCQLSTINYNLKLDIFSFSLKSYNDDDASTDYTKFLRHT